jgi:hypothetical protein
LIDLFKDVIDEDAKYGITTVQPNRATRKCRIRNLRMEYFLTKIAVILAAPKVCGNCERVNECTSDLVEQIIIKYNQRHKDTGDYYFL